MPVQYVSRGEWGAQAPRRRVLVDSSDMEGIVVHHTVTPGGGDLDARVRSVQNFHRNTRGWFDIAYSYLIGLDGRVYEGRGSGVQQGATNQVNNRFYAVAFIGNFGGSCDCAPKSPPEMKRDQLTPQAIEAFRCLRSLLIDEGVGPDLRLHREFKATSCPGDNIDNVRTYNWLLEDPIDFNELDQLQREMMLEDWKLVKRITYRRRGQRFKRIRAISIRNIERF